MKVTYIGPFRDGVVIDVLGVEVGHNETIDVPDAIGRSLLHEHENWARADKDDDEPAKAKSSKSTKTSDQAKEV